jgi:hypothetical protein
VLEYCLLFAGVHARVLSTVCQSTVPCSLESVHCGPECCLLCARVRNVRFFLSESRLCVLYVRALSGMCQNIAVLQSTIRFMSENCLLVATGQSVVFQRTQFVRLPHAVYRENTVRCVAEFYRCVPAYYPLHA